MKRFLALCLSLCLALALAVPVCAAEPEMLPDGSIINGLDLIEKGEVVMNGTVTVTGNNANLIQSLSIQLNGTMNLVHDVRPGYATLGVADLSIRGNPGRQGVITGGAIWAQSTMHLRDVQVTQVDTSTLAPVILDNDAVLTLSGQVTVAENKKEGAPRNIYLKKGAKIVVDGLDPASRIGVTLDPDYADGNENAAFIVDKAGNPLTAEQLGGIFFQDSAPDTPITSGMLKDGQVYTGNAPWPGPPITQDTAVALDKTELSLEPGQTAKLKATLTPADATYKYIFWTSSDETVATVTDSGVVTAMADGTATITAKSWYGHEATCAVTVKTPEPPTPVDPWPTEGLEGFVTRCYRVALSRDPDKAGHADWVRWLQEGTVDATSCTYGFVFSKEMNNKNLSDEAFVKTLYNLFMDREGETTGVAFWTSYLQDGHSREEVFYGFADSVEFARLKAGYGIA